MDSFRFWATIISGAVLALIGNLLAPNFPLPAPFSLIQTRAIYALVGVLIGFLTFARVSSWVVTAVTHWTRVLVYRLASEIINQLTQLASRGMPSFPLSGRHADESTLLSNLGGATILDTSSIIDGRILDVARCGFLSGLMVLPNFVLTELQQVADSADDLKRLRGRRGFEVVEKLKKVDGLKINIWDKEVAGKMVDDKLIKLGKILKGRVLTCDFNLNRVARLQGVKILNLNELANSLKSLPVPGEKLKVKILHPGKDKHQGVGYLLDGTMVVVKDGASLIGQECEIEVAKILQGPAGRMVFGRVN